MPHNTFRFICLTVVLVPVTLLAQSGRSPVPEPQTSLLPAETTPDFEFAPYVDFPSFYHANRPFEEASLTVDVGSVSSSNALGFGIGGRGLFATSVDGMRIETEVGYRHQRRRYHNDARVTFENGTSVPFVEELNFRFHSVRVGGSVLYGYTSYSESIDPIDSSTQFDKHAEFGLQLGAVIRVRLSSDYLYSAHGIDGQPVPEPLPQIGTPDGDAIILFSGPYNSENNLGLDAQAGIYYATDISNLYLSFALLYAYEIAPAVGELLRGGSLTLCAGYIF